MSIHLYTIGHSNLPLEQFLELLQQHSIEALADIRRFPGSRAFPHFNRESLAAALQQRGIEYHWFELLGGRRGKVKTAEGSVNEGLHNASFRNYADYMATESFRSGMQQLAELAVSKRTAIMCSEAVYWRCHRRLVSDYVLAGGGTVLHIFPGGEAKPHQLTAGAQLHSGQVTYPGEKTLFD